MTLPKLLDLYCGAGGAAFGYALAGFDITGVDINPQPNFPYKFYRGDALEFLENHGHEYDIIHASPPCQRYSTATGPRRDRHPDLIPPTRKLLLKTGIPWVIENVPQAPLINPIQLCGSAFNLKVRRHRIFESSEQIAGTACKHTKQGRPIGVYGQHPDRIQYLRPDGTQRGTKALDLESGRRAMGIDWMTWTELVEAIPPAYTEYIGLQLRTMV